MQITVSGLLNQFQRLMQGVLFPALQEQLGPLSDKHRQLAAVLSMIEIEALVGSWSGGVGRPAKHRRAIARAFVAKAVFNLNATRQLLDRLSVDVSLRRICGWESRREIPHESQFSRAFAEFAASELPQRLHAALIAETQQERLIGHISRDSTEIEGREKPLRTPVSITPAKPMRKRGRPKKGEQPLPPEPTRLERQAGMTLEQMLDDLPRACNAGSKNNSKGYKETWIGYKLHLDVADGQIPISCILTSASLYDSQAAIPLARLTAQRVTHLYDLMDSAYDAQSIHEQIRGLGQIPSVSHHGQEIFSTERPDTLTQTFSHPSTFPLQSDGGPYIAPGPSSLHGSFTTRCDVNRFKSTRAIRIYALSVYGAFEGASST
jgi:hypothetical protein